MSNGWVTEPDEVLTRARLSELYGGSRYSGGVVPTTTSPNVLLFSDPAEGVKYGYLYDGPDRSGTAYYYTGRGSAGDQTEVDNRAILDHSEHGRALRLFVAEGYVPRTRTRLQRYLGEFRLDPSNPYRREAAVDSLGETRTVLVFRLLPVGVASGRRLAKEPTREFDPAVADRAVLVPKEVNSQFFFEVSGTPGGVASRVESALVDSFAVHLGDAARFQRWAIRLADCPQPLLTDVYDPESATLYEAKGSSSRSDIRMAIGQLVDYRRHIPVKDLKCAILLPERPAPDLCRLIAVCGFGLVYKTDDGFASV